MNRLFFQRCESIWTSKVLKFSFGFPKTTRFGYSCYRRCRTIRLWRDRHCLGVPRPILKVRHFQRWFCRNSQVQRIYDQKSYAQQHLFESYDYCSSLSTLASTMRSDERQIPVSWRSASRWVLCLKVNGPILIAICPSFSSVSFGPSYDAHCPDEKFIQLLLLQRYSKQFYSFPFSIQTLFSQHLEREHYYYIQVLSCHHLILDSI